MNKTLGTITTTGSIYITSVKVALAIPFGIFMKAYKKKHQANYATHHQRKLV